MQYCPNCSAYQHDTGVKRCPKCGFDLTSHRETVKEVETVESSTRFDLSRYDESHPCPKCGSPTRIMDMDIDLKVEGERISIHGLKLMGGEITKKPVTMCSFHIVGRECSEGHKFYSDYTYRPRPLCPVCYDTMMKYGSSLFSCTRCNKHFPVRSWPEPDPGIVLLDEGWERT